MDFQTELELLIRARYPILYIVSSEETRAQNTVIEVAARRKKKVYEWSYSTGIVPAGTSIQSQKHRNAATKDPLTALDQVIEQVEPAIFGTLLEQALTASERAKLGAHYTPRPYVERLVRATIMDMRSLFNGLYESVLP